MRILSDRCRLYNVVNYSLFWLVGYHGVEFLKAMMKASGPKGLGAFFVVFLGISVLVKRKTLGCLKKTSRRLLKVG